ncbi:phage holin family protein [Candidatus Saccharibacteria bacterium]|nr:phage holin family protein [Candidatus Saccharibacteria bacterium]
MKNQFAVFVVRLVATAIGLWLCVSLFGSLIVHGETWLIFTIAALIFTLINTFIKPIITILSLPFILVTLGLFTFLINGVMVYVAVNLSPGIEMGFWGAFWSGLVMSLVNYLVSSAIQGYNGKQV